MCELTTALNVNVSKLHVSASNVPQGALGPENMNHHVFMFLQVNTINMVDNTILFEITLM